MKEGSKRSSKDTVSSLSECHLHPPLPSLSKHRLEVALKQSPRVLQVPSGVGLGGGQPGKGFVEDAHDPLLLFEGGEYKW